MNQSLADRLKQKITGKVSKDAPAPKKEKKKKVVEAKPPEKIVVVKDAPKQRQDKPRTCCATLKGKDVPHLPECPTLVPRKPKHIGFDLPGGRFPVGTSMTKTYCEGGFWSCLLGVTGCDVIFEAQDGNSLHAEHKVTRKYIAWLKAKQSEEIVIVKDAQKQREKECRMAPDGQIWVCGACGKTAEDRYGAVGVYDRGWDVSCIIHAVLCYKDKQFNDNGELTWRAV